jgi:predicted HicB family RNase H-like nuclease
MQFKIEKPEYVNRTFRITKELAETLSEIAQHEGISVNELVVQCCNYAISNMNTTDNKEE